MYLISNHNGHLIFRFTWLSTFFQIVISITNPLYAIDLFDLADETSNHGVISDNRRILLINVMSQEFSHTLLVTSLNQSTFDAITPVTGSVVDDAGQPLPGVNVIVKGSTIGTTTDSEGAFKLNVPEGSNVIVFSFIGFKNQEVTISGQSHLTITMDTDITALREVQVIGTTYFTTTKERSTMNIARVDGKELGRQPVTSLMNSVVGRMAGVEITPVNGTAGVAPRIQIRGNNSVRPGGEGSYPLYVIDGVQIESRPITTYNSGAFAAGFDPLSSIDPADIESIEVLKDAAATAIYGSRGANGVIRVTTKKAGIASPTSFEVQIYTGIGEIPNRLDLLSTHDYMQMRHEAFKNSGRTPGLLDFDMTGVWDTTSYTDFQEQLLGGRARISDVRVGMTGGTGLTSLSLNGGYHSEGTIYPGEFGMQRVTADLSVNHSSRDKKFSAMTSIYYAWTNNKLFADQNFLSTALSLPPVTPNLRDSVGNINFGEIELFPGFKFASLNNPLAALLKTDDAKSNSIISNATFSYELFEGLSMKTSTSMQYFTNKQVTKLPLSSFAPSQRSFNFGEASYGYNTRSSVMVEPQINYDRVVGNSQINVILGASWQNRNTSYQVSYGSGYEADELLNTLKGASDVSIKVDDNIQYRYAAAYARLAYSFQDRYLVDLTGRRDGSSRFGSGRKYGNFGAASVGWIFSKERIFKQQQAFFSFGKFRASYGITGNDQIPDYQYYNTYSPGQYPYAGGVTLSPTALYNPEYGWETTKKAEVALELGFLQDKIFLELAFYNNRSSNQLVNYRLPGSTGFQALLSNLPATIDNKGVEVVLNSTNIQTNRFRWQMSFNLSLPKNNLVEFPSLETSSYALLYKVGKPLSIQNLYKYAGINQSTGNFSVLDKNGDSEITPVDKSFMSYTGSRFLGGITNTIIYRNFELSFLMQFSKALVSGFLIHPVPGVMSNQRSTVMGRWRNEGDETDQVKFTTGENSSYYQSYVVFSDKNSEMVTFIRLKTASLSYRLPLTIASKLRLNETQIFFQGQNLLTFSAFDDALDPETLNGLPPLRIFTIGLHLKF